MHTFSRFLYTSDPICIETDDLSEWQEGSAELERHAKNKEQVKFRQLGHAINPSSPYFQMSLDQGVV